MSGPKRREPAPKKGPDLRKALERIADGEPALDGPAVERYRVAGVEHSDVARLARSSSPTHRQTARLRAAAMLAALDAK